MIDGNTIRKWHKNGETIETQHKKGVTTDPCPNIIDWDLVTRAKQYVKGAFNYIFLVVLKNGHKTYYINGVKVE